MATYTEQSDLVVDTVRDNKDLAASAYSNAMRALEALSSAIYELPSKVVVPDIGTAASTSWSSVLPGDSNNSPFESNYSAWLQVFEGTLEKQNNFTVAIDDAISFLQGLLSSGSDGLLLPPNYWDSLWDSVAIDIAKQQVAALRNARNHGAASYWQLPSETILVASRKIQDESLKTLQMERFQKATQQAVMGREDYWKAIQGIIDNIIKKVELQNSLHNAFLKEMLGELEIAKSRNVVTLDKAKLDQEAQETATKLTVSQSQWLSGLMAELKKALAELSFGYAQAAIAGTHVGLTAGTDIGFRQQVTASQNEEKKWNFDMA